MVSKSWCYTLNNPTEEEILTYRAIECQRHVSGREIAPTTGTPHLQGIITMKTAHRFSKMSKILARAHIEIAHSESASEKYCMKDDDVVIDIDNRKQGKRNDLQPVAEKIIAGSKVSDVAMEAPTMFIKFSKGMRDLAAIVSQRATNHFRFLTVELIIRKTGTAKTRSVFDKYGYENTYILDMSQSTLWFDGYEGQDVICFDEFRGQCPFSFFLRLLDGYPVRLPIKGSFTYAAWTKVCITSNRPWTMWYPSVTEDDTAALARRLGVEVSV